MREWCSGGAGLAFVCNGVASQSNGGSASIIALLRCCVAAVVVVIGRSANPADTFVTLVPKRLMRRQSANYQLQKLHIFNKWVKLMRRTHTRSAGQQSALAMQ